MNMSFEDFLLGSFVSLVLSTVIGVSLTWILIVLVAGVYFQVVLKLSPNLPPPPPQSSYQLLASGAREYLHGRDT